MGFSTQAPSPALMKAVNSRALAAWYSFAASLDSWYVVGLVILVRSRCGGTCGGRDTCTLQAATGAATGEKPGLVRRNDAQGWHGLGLRWNGTQEVRSKARFNLSKQWLAGQT